LEETWEQRAERESVLEGSILRSRDLCMEFVEGILLWEETALGVEIEHGVENEHGVEIELEAATGHGVGSALEVVSELSFHQMNRE
jgi:hypothetical protein